MKSEQIGSRIAKILKENRYSQAKFAEEIGMTQSVISEILRGIREIDRLVNIVADKFGVSRDYLITGIETKKADYIASDKLPKNGLSFEEKQRLIEKLEVLYKTHQDHLDKASQVMKEISAISKLLIVGVR